MRKDKGHFNKLSYKVLTLVGVFFVLSFISQEVFAQTFNVEKAKTHLRWNVFTSKDNLSISQRGRLLTLKTLDLQLFSDLKKQVKKGLNNRYIQSVDFLDPSQKNNVSTIKVMLSNNDVEVFNFYRERDGKHVFDFWSNNTEETPLSKLKTSKAKAKKTKVKKVASKAPKAAPKKTRAKIAKKPAVNKLYRDFRYGASFVWDYDGISPQLPDNINLAVKTPEYFYPIVNRSYDKNDKEAHLQLILNFYRKKKYGLMYKSIKLFQEKYGAEDNIDFIEYVKANAIIRDHIAGGNREPLKMSINMLTAIAERTKTYDLQKAIYKYLLTYYKKTGEYVEALAISKKFYVNSKENFDYEESSVAAESILYNLAMLNQVDKVSELINDQTIKKILNPGKLISYEIYTYHRMGNIKEAIRLFEAKKAGMNKPIAAEILYNIGEAYFRTAQYQKSVVLFDEFISSYSYHTNSSHARLRMALSYEILEKPIDQTIVLYKNAINRSQDDLVSAEARIRYAALRSVRKKKLVESDRENRAFLDIDENIKLTKNLKKLLWLTRLRSFIVDKKFDQALTYLSALPLDTLKRVERRVFEADGAEIVYGLIQNDYLNSEYAKVVKKWNKFSSIYINKVANDTFMNFIVGKSYLRLGLYDGFDRIYTDFKKLEKTPNRTFPLWVERHEKTNSVDVLLELALIKDLKLKNWDLAQRGVATLKNKNPALNKIHYYNGIIEFNKKNYKKAAAQFEKFLAGQKSRSIFDPMELASMVNMYTDSLYELGMLSKFQKVADAILADTANYAPSSPFMKNTRERLSYLSIEIEAGKGSAKSSLSLEPMIMKFKKEYPKTEHLGRVNYLLGTAFAKNKKPQQARELFEEILNNAETTESIKEMVRSELSLMAIKERTI